MSKIIDEKSLKNLRAIPFDVHNAKIQPKTGDWRTFKPVIDLNKCIRCRTCWLNCPDSAIMLDNEDFPRINYKVCKGCLICWHECPVKAITKKEDLYREVAR